jgi:hypothetical protein
MAYYQQKKIESALGLLQKNTPTKTINILLDNETVNLNTSNTESAIIDVTDIKSISLVGNQTTATVTLDNLCYIEMWISDSINSADFYGPVATGYFVGGYLQFGTIDLNASFLKIKVINDSTATNTIVSIKAFMSS